jgi:hypothetical protein
MAKLNPIKVSTRSVGHITFSHSYVTEVLPTGIFQTHIPDEQKDVIVELAEKPEHKSVNFKYNKADKPVLQATELAPIQYLLDAYGRVRVETVNTTELIIFYRTTSNTAYFVADGEVYPNGVGAGQGDWKNPGHGSHMRRLDYTAGITARVVAKTTARHANGFHIIHAEPELGDDTFGSRLNSFIHVACPGKDFWHAKVEGQRKESLHDDNSSDLRIYNNTGWQFMPYTEESAKFFYEMMLNVCRLSEGLSKILGDDPTQLAETIALMKALPNFSK